MEFKKKHTAAIYTLGCKVNQYESQAMSEFLEKNGVDILKHNDICDAYIINTCTVTAESDRKARQFIRRAISKNPDAFITVTGCLAQTSPHDISAIEGIDCIVGNANKLVAAKKTLELLDKGKKNDSAQIITEDIDTAPFEPMSITKFDRTRAYVKIEDGCDNKCTYCIIPYARGAVRSKSPTELISEVEILVNNGCQEIVLTGIETASYGKDLNGINLADILCKINSIRGIKRVRLGSLDPSLIKPDFVKKIASLSCLAPHFHLSLQSGSNNVLAMMKRKYNAKMAMSAIKLLRENIPNVKFSTDVIVGFPGESEEDFNDTVNFVKEAGFLSVHIFPYSKRKGTPAAIMNGQISKEEKARRLHVLERAAKESRKAILKNQVENAPITTVLFETYDNGYAYGHTADFIEVAVPSDSPLRSQMLKVRLLNTDGSICFGELLQ